MQFPKDRFIDRLLNTNIFHYDACISGFNEPNIERLKILGNIYGQMILLFVLEVDSGPLPHFALDEIVDRQVELFAVERNK
jgi:hypothetical protein